MSIAQLIQNQLQKACSELFQVDISDFELQETRKDFEGDITLVVFPILKFVKQNPVVLGDKLGEWMVSNLPEIKKYNVVSGFLNLVFTDLYYLDVVRGVFDLDNYGFVEQKVNDKAVIVEYSSPNTNKPLHLGTYS